MKWLKNGVGQGFIFYPSIPAHYTFDDKFINLSNLHTSAFLKYKLWYSKTVIKELWDLSKLLTNTLASLILITF